MLVCAAHCHEGLKDYERSEALHKAAAMRYGSTAWYVWCRRTGRGNVAAAKKLAEKHVDGLGDAPPSQLIDLGMFHMLNDKPGDAFEAFRDSLAGDKNPFSGLMGAALAVELGRLDDAKQLLNTTAREGHRMRLEGKTRFEKIAAAKLLLTLLDLPEWNQVHREQLDTILINASSSGERCNLEYFVGRFLELKGQADQAAAYYRRCYHAHDDKLTRALAAERLRAAKLNPDDPPPPPLAPKRADFKSFELARWTRDLGALIEIGLADGTQPIGNESMVPDQKFQVIAVQFSSDGAVRDDDLRRLSGLESCQRLWIHDGNVTDEGLAHLAGLTGLRELRLRALGISDEGLRHLAGLTNVELMMFEDIELSGIGLKHLAGMNRLKALTIRGPLTDEGLALCANFPALDLLSLDQTKITGATLGQLSGLPLRILGLGRCDNFTDDSLAHVAALTSLDQFRLSRAAADQRGYQTSNDHQAARPQPRRAAADRRGRRALIGDDLRSPDRASCDQRFSPRLRAAQGGAARQEHRVVSRSPRGAALSRAGRRRLAGRPPGQMAADSLARRAAAARFPDH